MDRNIKKKINRSKIHRAVLFIISCILWISVLSEVMKTKMMDGFSDVTRKINGFYSETENSLDFIFLGSSRMYSAVNPAVLWKNYGMAAYDFCCNEQSYSITYYYLKEALKKQKPKAVIVDISFGVALTETREPMRHLNLDYLFPSLNRLEAICSNNENKERWDYIFSIRKWHSDWYNLKEDNFKYLFWRGNNPYKGFSYVAPEGDIHITQYHYPYDMRENMEQYYIEPLPENLEWIDRMAELANKNGVDLILIAVPDGSPPESQGYVNGIFKHAAENHGIFCKNYSLEMTGMHHLTADLAEEFTEKLGADLVEMYEIDDKREDPAFRQWEETVQVYRAEMNAIELKKQMQLSDYENIVKRGDYCLFAVQQPWICENGSLEHIKNILEELGMDYPASSGENWIGSNLAQAEDMQEIEGKMGDEYYYVCSNGITIGKQAYPYVGGVQFLVYDKVLKRVIDSFYLEGNNLEIRR